MAVHTRYLVTRQSNRNLALDAEDAQMLSNLVDADTEAHRKARLDNRPMYVHVVTVEPIRQHIPRTTVESSDFPR